MICSQTGRSVSSAYGCGPSPRGECLRMMHSRCPSLLSLLLPDPVQPCLAACRCSCGPDARALPGLGSGWSLCLQCHRLSHRFPQLPQAPFRCCLLQEASVVTVANHHKLPSLTLLEASSPKSGHQQGRAPTEGSEGRVLLCLSQLLGAPGAWGL